MSSCCAFGVVHRHLSLQQISDFVDSINNQTLRPSKIYLGLDSVLCPNAYNLLDELIPELEFYSVVYSSRGLGWHLSRLPSSAFDYTYIFRVDLDDYSLHSRFHDQSFFMDRNPEVDVLGAYVICSSSSRTLRYPLVHSEIASSVHLCPLAHPTICFRSVTFARSGGYSSLARHQDLELWFRLVSQGFVFANLPFPVVLYSPPSRRQTIGSLLLNLRVVYTGCQALRWSLLRAIFSTLIVLFKEILPLWLKTSLRAIVTGQMYRLPT